MTLKINTTERHEYNHVVVLSKAQVEEVIAHAIRCQIDLPLTSPKRKIEWRFEWGDTSIDSGLRKEQQIIVRITDDIKDLPSAPTEAETGL